MTNPILNQGTVHKLPADLAKALKADMKSQSAWQSLTPLARNEWICWTISVKHQKTRDDHVKRVVSQLKQGKRRPCCWIGCVHRQDKELSQSVKWYLSRKALTN
ncbi:MAG TPA: YdeI/OmpD-associated family protein [Candidatus Saccharimonadales bacterium]|nr:YdeI/OmpD-associated family protein [Candidatus Saccharimonadales bacterium]